MNHFPPRSLMKYAGKLTDYRRGNSQCFQVFSCDVWEGTGVTDIVFLSDVYFCLFIFCVENISQLLRKLFSVTYTSQYALFHLLASVYHTDATVFISFTNLGLLSVKQSTLTKTRGPWATSPTRLTALKRTIILFKLKFSNKTSDLGVKV